MEANRAAVGVCAWCGEPAYTRLITKSATNRRRKIKTPVCDEHERKFTHEGASSERLEAEKYAPKEADRPRGAPHRR